MVRTLFFAICVAAIYSPCGGAELTGAELPNIIIVYADDMGHGDLAALNPDSKVPTPNLDRLAKQGLLLRDAHSSSGICTPSRYALLTGRYHWRKMHSIVGSWGNSVFAAERLTLPEMLKTRGYRTACIGKWHLGFDWSSVRKPDAKPVLIGKKQKTWRANAFDWSQPIPNGPLDHGFDYYFGDDVPNFPPYAWIENDRVIEPPTVRYKPDPQPAEGSPEGRPGPMVAGWKQDAVMPTLTAKTVEWIGQQKGKDGPFFLYWSWTSPHAPIVPTAGWRGKTDAGGYGDYLAQSDHHFGTVMQAIDECGFHDNTIVVFSSDNGPEKYAYDRVKNHGHRSSGQLRGVKRDIWEGGHRVPFVVRWPGVVTAGTTSDGLMSQTDLMATLAQVVGFELSQGTAEDSYNQLPLWKGGSSARTTMVHNTNRSHYAIRQGDYVLIDAPSGDVTGVPKWFSKQEGFSDNPDPGALYQLGSDLGQLTNLYAEQPERVEAMRDALSRIRKSGEVR